jgi:hypothetical protein
LATAPADDPAIKAMQIQGEAAFIEKHQLFQRDALDLSPKRRAFYFTALPGDAGLFFNRPPRR